MRQSTKRLTSSLFALTLFVGAVILFINFIQPAYGEIIRLRGEEAARAQFADTEADVVGQVKNLVTLFNSEIDKNQTVSLALPLTPEVAETVGQLHGIAMANNLSADAYQASAMDPQVDLSRNQAPDSPALVAAPLGEVKLTAGFRGTYRDIKNFLQNIETNVRIMDMITVGFQSIVWEGQDLYRVDLNITAYYQGQPPPTVNPAASTNK